MDDPIACLDEGHMLLTFSTKDGPVVLWKLSLADGSLLPMDITLDRYNAGAPRFIGNSDIYYAGKPGYFVIKGTDKVLLCRICKNEPEILREIFCDPNIYAIFLDGKDVHAATNRNIYTAEDALV